MEAGDEGNFSMVSVIYVHVNVTNSSCQFCDLGVKGDHNLHKNYINLVGNPSLVLV